MLLFFLGCYTATDAGTCAATLPELTARLREAEAITRLAPVWSQYPPDHVPLSALPAAGWPVSEDDLGYGPSLLIDADGALHTGVRGLESIEDFQHKLEQRRLSDRLHVRVFADASAPASSVTSALRGLAGRAAHVSVVARQSPQPVFERQPIPAAFAEGVGLLEGRSTISVLPRDFDPFPGLFSVCPVDFEAVAAAPAEDKPALIVPAMLEGYARCGCKEPVSHWVFWYQYGRLPAVFLTDRLIDPAALPEGAGTWGALVETL